MLGKRFSSALAATALIAASGTAGAATNFDTDVAASIDLGLAWFDTTANCFNTPAWCGDAIGLVGLALLEKRPSQDAAPQGYSGASPADQARMRRVTRYIIDQVNAQGTGFYAYRDGAYMMALSVYMRTGGPDKDDGPTTELDGAPLTLKQTLDRVLDRVIANQAKNIPNGSAPYPVNNGYWCYTGPDCRDSSTTQLVMAGLASARAVYISDQFADPARKAALDAATELARKAYEGNGTPGDYRGFYITNYGSDPGPAYGCGNLPGEKGHGYNAGSVNSIQQTASGLWVQLVGGAGPNWPNVQSYMKWLRHRYRWDNINVDYFDEGWGASYWYYLWSSFKAYQFIVDSQIPPSTGNIGVADIGNLAADAEPACRSRQVHRDPDTLPRIALWGSNGAGYYGEETPRIYFDYAYTIMGYQCPNGDFSCNGAPGYWNQYAHNAYALLVLQRSVGGGCLDSDRDGICDSEDENVTEPPVPPSGGLYCDKNGNGTVDQSDITALMNLLKGKTSIPVDATNKWANYANTGVEATRINMTDYQGCWMVFGGKAPKKYY